MIDTDVRVPPQNLDAEKALIGSLLLDRNELDEINIKPEQFYSESMARIFRLIDSMSRAGLPVDLVTISEELARSGQLEAVGGLGTIVELFETVPHSKHAPHYARIVAEKWMLRQVIYAAREVESDCFGSDRTPDEILASAVQRLSQLSDGNDRDGLVSLSESCDEVLEAIRKRQNHEVDGGRLSTGFADLDYHLGGFGEGQMIVLAARPAIGKSALGLNIAANAMKAGNGVLFVSLEMSHQELTERLLSSEASINGHDITSGNISEHQMYELSRCADAVSRNRLFYLDNKHSIADITAKARLAYRKHGVRFVVADYLQLVDAESKRGMLREQAVSAVSRELKRLAMELKIPVLVLSQLNREVEKRDDKRPKLSDIRESGAIEQDANVVLFLHRPDAYDAEDRPGQAEVIIAKNRTGPTGTVLLTWRKEFCRFESFAPMQDYDFTFASDAGNLVRP
ncbi:MAG: replicative DNA helicase [Planctomycetales bacterium]|nr:replicative DNA helicase [Planctomycetales bacterium]